MRIAGFDEGGDRRHGLVIDDQLHPLPLGIDLFAALDDIPNQDRMLPRARQQPLSQVRLLAPVLPPPFVTSSRSRSMSRAYGAASTTSAGYRTSGTQHRRSTFNPYSILGPVDDVPVPPGSRALDFELEVGAIIGRPGRDLTPEDARDVIVGYTIFNDWSRDLQQAEMRVGLGPAWGKDTATRWARGWSPRTSWSRTATTTDFSTWS